MVIKEAAGVKYINILLDQESLKLTGDQWIYYINLATKKGRKTNSRFIFLQQSMTSGHFIQLHLIKKKPFQLSLQSMDILQFHFPIKDHLWLDHSNIT